MRFNQLNQLNKTLNTIKKDKKKPVFPQAFFDFVIEIQKTINVLSIDRDDELRAIRIFFFQPYEDHV